ncbi:MAG: alpha/beta fold hydrolase [Alphaproteobacteria bacterium]|nr:alpha/beta fold hydrolase [Alphaproteobacteria bacterium]
MVTDVQSIAVEDIEYLRHGDRAMMLRLFRPDGAGPFPVVVDLHGGAWNNGSLEECQARDEFLAEAGIAATALDFRHAADGYPTSLVDINYAIRWLKTHASSLRLDPERVAVTGQSSGGHLAMLAAMRPEDPRYASIEIEGSKVDARVRCVGMTWPVINPVSRYRYALRGRNSSNPPGWIGNIPERHDTYWGTEDAMIEGNPMLAMERGEPVITPPAIWIQGRPDPIHDYRDPESPLDLNEPERFAANYREAGGEIEIVDIDQATRASETSFAPLAAFFRKQLV